MNTDTNNEVARLRELLNRAIEIADEFWKNQKQAVTVWHGELADELEEIKAKARLAPAPEETQDGATMKEWYGGFSKIESTEPSPEWRELGPDEVIGAEDEYNPASLGEWIKVPHGWIGETCDITKIRTRRPLPKQERIPPRLDAEIEVVDDPSTYSVTEARHATADAIRYLRDEIQKLKEAR